MPGTTNQMNPSQAQAFLDAPRHAIAAAIRPDGAPQLSPIWFLYEDERLYFSISLGSAKYRQLRRDPRIALCIDAGHPDARAVSISGTAELITDESPERADLEWRILRRYHESDEDAHRYESEVAEEGPSALVVVSPERIIGWDYN
jgi:PPOX class probable F420-dependent enzyme